MAFLGLRLIAAKLRHARQCAPGPPWQLPVAKLFRDPDRESQVLLGFVKTPELALGDSARRPGVGELPSGAELGEDRHRLVEPRHGLLTPAEVVEHPRLLHVSVGDAELVAALLGELARILDELQRPFHVVHLGAIDR